MEIDLHTFTHVRRNRHCFVFNASGAGRTTLWQPEVSLLDTDSCSYPFQESE